MQLSSEKRNKWFLDKTISKSYAPSKVKGFLWLALFNKLNTRVVLLIKLSKYLGYCDIYGMAVETRDHFFLSCLFAASIWDVIYTKFSICLPPNNQAELFSFWIKKYFYGSLFSAIICLLVAVSWSIWNKRNACLFLHKHGSHGGVFIKALSLTVDWSC